MKCKRSIFCLYIGIIIFLTLKWYVGYRFIPSTSPHEELIDEVSIFSNFTNIAYMLSVYTLFYLFLIIIQLPSITDIYCIRYSRKRYIKKGLKIIFYNALIFSSLLVILQALFLMLQFNKGIYLITNYYIVGSIFTIILWTNSYTIIGLLFYFLYLCTKSKILSILITSFVTIGLLAIFRFYHINTLFSEIDVLKSLYYGNFNISLCVFINFKYVLCLYIIFTMCETVFSKRDLIMLKEQNVYE